MRRLLALVALIATPAFARDSLGVYDGWGAFRDAQPPRCFAIAEPSRRGNREWKPFASVAHWPTRRIRGQIHIRLSREKRPEAGVTLSIDGRRFPMTGGRVDAWAPDARIDAAIVAAMRSGRRMSISTSGFTDSYALKGAATAIDAAALGCARGR